MADGGCNRGVYTWQDCEDFKIPENSVRFGNDESGSEIFCGKAWYDGQELPAKVIPERGESIVACDDGEKAVLNCRKVLICDIAKRNHRSIEMDHCHRRRRHCHRREDDCCSSSSDEDWKSTQTETNSSSKNESRFLVKCVKSTSNTTTTSIKKHKKKHHHRRCSDDKSCEKECWDEQCTRIVPKITYEPRVRYEPKVTMERTVRYEPEHYSRRVCCERCYDCCEEYCDPCDGCVEPCDPCDEPCRPRRRCKADGICEQPIKPSDAENEEGAVRPEKSDSPQPSKKCW